MVPLPALSKVSPRALPAAHTHTHTLPLRRTLFSNASSQVNSSHSHLSSSPSASPLNRRAALSRPLLPLSPYSLHDIERVELEIVYPSSCPLTPPPSPPHPTTASSRVPSSCTPSFLACVCVWWPRSPHIYQALVPHFYPGYRADLFFSFACPKRIFVFFFLTDEAATALPVVCASQPIQEEAPLVKGEERTERGAGQTPATATHRWHRGSVRFSSFPPPRPPHRFSQDLPPTRPFLPPPSRPASPSAVDTALVASGAGAAA